MYTPPEVQMEALRAKLTTELGSKLHDEWRAPREIKDESGNGTGKYEKRIKVLVQLPDGNQKWYNDGDSKIPDGSTVIKSQDIANTPFEKLDPKWQADNGEAAKVAMDEVFKANKTGQSLNSVNFIEKASAEIHAKWLDRNGWQATDVQKKPYAELPEDEKEKDRVQLRKAIELFNKEMHV